MANTLKLGDLLASLDTPTTDDSYENSKSASAHADAVDGASVSVARDELLTALQAAESDTANSVPVKNANDANAPTALEGLNKIASDLAASEAAAMEKEAHFYGAAVADGFMSRIGQYEQNAPAAKTAGYADDGTFEEFAAENPELVKQAMELGYRDGMAAINYSAQAQVPLQTKVANALPVVPGETAEDRATKVAAVQAGYNDTMEKLAAVETGYSDTMEKLAAVEAGYGDTMEKFAALETGYSDTMEKLAAVETGYNDTVLKVSEEVYAIGANDTAKLLQG